MDAAAAAAARRAETELDYLDADDVAPEACLVYLKTVQGVSLKYLFEVMKDMLIACVHMRFSAQGVWLSQGDTSMNAMIQLDLQSEGFEEYHCEGTQTIAVEGSEIAKALKGTKPQDTVFMFVHHQWVHKLCVFRFDSVSRRLCKWSLPLLDPQKNHMLVVPPLAFDCAFTVPSELLHNMCKDLDSGQRDRLVCLKVYRLKRGREEEDRWRVSMRYQGMPMDQQEDLDEKHDERGLMWVEKPTRAVSHSYKLQDLLLFCKAQPLSKMLEVRISKEGLVRIEYKVAAMGRLVLMTTPNITDLDL